MSTFTETILETFQVVSCYTCALRFGITSDLYRRVVTNADGSIFCPACGSKTYWGESQDKKRIRELENKLRWEAEQSALQKTLRDEAEASLRATKGVVTKLTKRAAAGTCPCCNRTFKQLAQHMATKHPEFSK